MADDLGRLWRWRSVVEVAAVACVTLAAMYDQRSVWWGVWHHAAQAFAMTTFFVMPLAGAIGAGWGLSLLDNGNEELVRTGSRSPTMVRLHHFLRAVATSWLGAAVAAAIIWTSLFFVSSSFWWMSSLHWAVTFVWITAAACAGFVVASYVRISVVPLLVGLGLFIAVVAVESLRGGRNSFLPADNLFLSVRGKSPSFLALQLAVGLGLVGFLQAVLRPRKLSSIVWLGLAFFGASVVASADNPVVEVPDFSAPACENVEGVPVCVTAIHSHLLPEVVSLFDSSVHLASELELFDTLVEYGVNDGGAAPAGRTAVFGLASGHNQNVDLMDPGLTLGSAIPAMLGIEECLAFAEPTREQLDNEDGFVPTLSFQGEVHRWFSEVVAEQEDLQITDHYGVPEAESSGLAEKLASMDTDARSAWFAENSERLGSCTATE